MNICQVVHRHLLTAYLHQCSLVHSTQDELRVRRPFHVRNLVQAGVEVQDLQRAHIPYHQPVLNAGSLQKSYFFSNGRKVTEKNQIK